MGQKFIVKLRTEVKFQLGVLLRGYCVDDMSGSSEKGSGSSSLASSAMATPTATLRSLKKISSTLSFNRGTLRVTQFRIFYAERYNSKVHFWCPIFIFKHAAYALPLTLR